MDWNIGFPQRMNEHPLVANVKIQTKKNEAPDLIDIIMSKDSGPDIKMDKEQLISRIDSKPFKEFQIRHKKVAYFKMFIGQNVTNKDYFVNKKGAQEPKSSPHQYHPKQIRDCFDIIMHKIITTRLYGHQRNKKEILKNFLKFLLNARTEPFSLLQLITNFKVETVPWLMNIKNEKSKRIIFGKFVKWLFYYFLSILNHNFHFDYVRERRIYIYKTNWHEQKKKFLKKMVIKNHLLPIKESKEEFSCHPLKFLSKPDGLRYIMMQQYDPDQKDELLKVMAILKYLKNFYLRSSGKNVSNLFETFGEKQNKKQVYLIASDIKNAYGSINQTKLYNIIASMIENIPDVLYLKKETRKNHVRYRYMNDLNNSNSNEYIAIKKYEFQTRVYKVIFDTKCLINKKVYILCHGIGQGLLLSSVLCDIYYTSMREKYLSPMERRGSQLFMYVDDIMFLTHNLSVAKKFLERVFKGIPEYCCFFNKLKVKKNFKVVDGDSVSTIISFLGWNIDCSTLCVSPDYPNARYTSKYNTLTESSFQNKLRHTSTLKLEKFLFSSKINSECQILRNIQAVCTFQANRCFALLRGLNTNVCEDILSIITQVNSRIAGKMLKYQSLVGKRTLMFCLIKALYRLFKSQKHSHHELFKQIEKSMMQNPIYKKKLKSKFVRSKISKRYQ